jgi:D-glycerate 3-kinase
LRDSLALEGVELETISLDDFYLPYADRLNLDPTVYKYRGPPGTHSIDLMKKVLQEFRSHSNADGMYVPVFDKSCHAGKGDRVGFRKLSPST